MQLQSLYSARSVYTRTIVLVLLLSGAISLLGACQPVMPVAPVAPAAETQAEVVAIPEFTISLSDEGFDVPDVMPLGAVKVRYENTSSLQYGAPALAKLADGVTGDVCCRDGQAAEESYENVMGMLTFLGSAEETIYELTPGDYVAIFSGDSEGEAPPFAYINIQDEGNTAIAPTADLVVKFEDFAFVLPDQIKAGKQMWQFVNVGTQVHHMLAQQLPDDMSVEDIIAWASSEVDAPPPFIGEDGMPNGPFFAFESLSPGATSWTEVDLVPGTYTIFCLLPDFSDMPPTSHIVHGMHRTIEVVE